ncbi:hypothetical protein J437_LFUL006517 [Ladona fulva]|uniref:Uncharacterized protein n=1 Tax=Ladona fulva TaxID=123851 RepID=A0A8K0KFX4_LADFU|nr:hypothetical protein J437_LFUL006517 [Ladona fulva]
MTSPMRLRRSILPPVTDSLFFKKRGFHQNRDWIQRYRFNGKDKAPKGYNTSKLKEKTTAKQYKSELEKKLETKQVNWKRESVEGKWNIIKNVLQETADEFLGVEDREKRQGWFDEECREIIKKRNDARRKMIEKRTRTNVEQFRQKRKEAEKLCRRKKEEFGRKNGLQNWKMLLTGTRGNLLEVKMFGWHKRVEARKSNNLEKVIEEELLSIDSASIIYNKLSMYMKEIACNKTYKSKIKTTVKPSKLVTIASLARRFSSLATSVPRRRPILAVTPSCPDSLKRDERTIYIESQQQNPAMAVICKEGCSLMSSISARSLSMGQP